MLNNNLLSDLLRQSVRGSAWKSVVNSDIDLDYTWLLTENEVRIVIWNSALYSIRESIRESIKELNNDSKTNL